MRRGRLAVLVLSAACGGTELTRIQAGPGELTIATVLSSSGGFEVLTAETGAPIRAETGEGDRVVVFVLAAADFVDPNGVPRTEDELTRLQIRAGPDAREGGCEYCSSPWPWPPMTTHPGDRCAIPKFARVYEGERRLETLDPDVERVRRETILSWPGECACPAQPPPPELPDFERVVDNEGAKEWLADDGAVLLVRAQSVDRISVGGQRTSVRFPEHRSDGFVVGDLLLTRSPAGWQRLPASLSGPEVSVAPEIEIPTGVTHTQTLRAPILGHTTIAIAFDSGIRKYRVYGCTLEPLRCAVLTESELNPRPIVEVDAGIELLGGPTLQLIRPDGAQVDLGIAPAIPASSATRVGEHIVACRGPYVWVGPRASADPTSSQTWVEQAALPPTGSCVGIVGSHDGRGVLLDQASAETHVTPFGVDASGALELGTVSNLFENDPELWSLATVLMTRNEAPGFGLLLAFGGPWMRLIRVSIDGTRERVAQRFADGSRVGPIGDREDRLLGFATNGVFELDLDSLEPGSKLAFVQGERLDGEPDRVWFDSTTESWLLLTYPRSLFRARELDGAISLSRFDIPGARHVAEIVPGVFAVAGPAGNAQMSAVYRVEGDFVEPVEIEWDDPYTEATEIGPAPEEPPTYWNGALGATYGQAWLLGEGEVMLRVGATGPALRVHVPGLRAETSVSGRAGRACAGSAAFAGAYSPSDSNSASAFAVRVQPGPDEGSWVGREERLSGAIGTLDTALISRRGDFLLAGPVPSVDLSNQQAGRLVTAGGRRSMDLTFRVPWLTELRDGRIVACAIDGSIWAGR
ncbi:MAG: hypothetical protein HYV07_08335 [Deltaproteobacteria bacterium]|nr:hypothetical protein [Deltaproteobacteria bacterium]